MSYQIKTTGDWSRLLNNKVAIVTGAGGSIGRAIAIALYQHGCKLTISDYNNDTLQETYKILHSIDNYVAERVTAVQCNNSDEQQVKQYIDTTLTKYGTIDILVNNAAVFQFGAIEDVTAEQWTNVLDANIKGYAFHAKHVVPHMKQQRSGSIIHMCSISSIVSQPCFVPYNTTKAAVLEMSKCLAHDLGAYNIRVNAIGPGNIETPATVQHAKTLNITYEQHIENNMTEHFLKQMGQVEDVANAVVFLCSDLSKFTTGALLMIDGGYSTH